MNHAMNSTIHATINFFFMASPSIAERGAKLEHAG
jgi:hypothetical protein